jgi:enoyl-[acyl-carrier protein] reductase I
MDDRLRRLEGKKGLVVGIANEHSIAYGCARAFRAFGAELALTYLNDKARRFVQPLADELEAPIFLPLDVQTSPGSTPCPLRSRVWSTVRPSLWIRKGQGVGHPDRGRGCH